VKASNSFRALIQPGFRMPPVTVCLHGAFIFSAAKIVAQFFRPVLSERKQRHDTSDYNHDQTGVERNRTAIRGRRHAQDGKHPKTHSADDLFLPPNHHRSGCKARCLYAIEHLCVLISQFRVT
jgi:hypothetical protein